MDLDNYTSFSNFLEYRVICTYYFYPFWTRLPTEIPRDQFWCYQEILDSCEKSVTLTVFVHSILNVPMVPKPRYIVFNRTYIS